MKLDNKSRQTIIGSLVLVILLVLSVLPIGFNIVYIVSASQEELLVTINGSTYIEETNATLLGYLSHNGSANATCWFQCNEWTNDFSSPTINQSVGVIANQTTFSANITLDNGTFYYVKTRVNNSFGWNASANTTTLLTKPQSATGIDTANISGGFNISWTHGDGFNLSWLVVNEFNVPTDTGNGTTLHIGKNDFYHHTVLTPETRYYYRIWEYTSWNTSSKLSDGNYNASEWYSGTYVILSNPNPANESTGIQPTVVLWNITMESQSGNIFNWTIQCSNDIGINASNNDINGSKFINITLGNLSHNTTYTVWVNASETANNNWSNETFIFQTVLNNAPTITFPNPSNESIDILLATTTWNATIVDADGDSFNWTIQGSRDIGINAGTDDTNGSKSINITDNLSHGVTYTVWVNATDGNDTTGTMFWFTVVEEVFVLVAECDFGGNPVIAGDAPIISSVRPINESTGIIIYPFLNVSVLEPQSQNFNITWATNVSGSWVDFAWNETCTSSETYRQRVTWVNASSTKFWWQVRINDTSTPPNWINGTYYFTTSAYNWGNWSSWWEFDYSASLPTNLAGAMYNWTVINLTWTKGLYAADNTTILRNESGWPTYPMSPSNGTIVYNGSLDYFNDTGLANATLYHYTAWSWNTTYQNHSLLNDTATAATQGFIEISNPFPVNESTSVARPPSNLSVQINGTNLNITFYFLNLSQHPSVWQEAFNWANNDTKRFAINNLYNGNFSTQFIWGNTTYYWWVNVTDGVDWVNRSYSFDTLASAGGANARYDINKDNAVDVFDLNVDWSKRAGQATYDNLYDVNNDGIVDVFDLNDIWAERS